MKLTTQRSGSTSRNPTLWVWRTCETQNCSLLEKVITPLR